MRKCKKAKGSTARLRRLDRHSAEDWGEKAFCDPVSMQWKDGALMLLKPQHALIAAQTPVAVFCVDRYSVVVCR